MVTGYRQISHMHSIWTSSYYQWLSDIPITRSDRSYHSVKSRANAYRGKSAILRHINKVMKCVATNLRALNDKYASILLNSTGNQYKWRLSLCWSVLTLTSDASHRESASIHCLFQNISEPAVKLSSISSGCKLWTISDVSLENMNGSRSWLWVQSGWLTITYSSTISEMRLCFSGK